MYGFFNKLLRVDLEAERYRIENISDDILRESLGGKGLGTHLMLKEIPAETKPLSNKNKLIFMVKEYYQLRGWDSMGVPIPSGFSISEQRKE